ncbi:MAG TPA: YetF domain-containing protein, partial [Aeromicrobium sp.]|nr:YetF domain-containing protein [Aeromicrobium sp.]
MLHDIFHLDVSVVEKLLRPVLIYAFLAIALRVAGKRELAQLNSLDFIVLLAVANAVQNGIIGDDVSVTGAVLGASALLLLNGILAVVLFRMPRLRTIAEGTPRTLIRMGVMDYEALRKERLTVDQLMAAIATQGAGGLDDVEEAVLEPNGTIVARMKEMDRDAMRFMDLS